MGKLVPLSNRESLPLPVLPGTWERLHVHTNTIPLQETCPRRCKGIVLLFFRGYRSPLSATRALTLWIVSNEPGLLRAKDSSRSEIAVLSGPIWDRANRVTQACHLKRIVSKTRPPTGPYRRLDRSPLSLPLETSVGAP